MCFRLFERWRHFHAFQQLHPEERPLEDQIELLLTITRVIVIITHTIHVTMYGIFTYIWSILMVNVSNYTSPMDAMGKTVWNFVWHGTMESKHNKLLGWRDLNSDSFRILQGVGCHYGKCLPLETYSPHELEWQPYWLPLLARRQAARPMSS